MLLWIMFDNESEKKCCYTITLALDRILMMFKLYLENMPFLQYSIYLKFLYLYWHTILYVCTYL